MAAFTKVVSRVMFGVEVKPVRNILQQQNVFVNSRRTNFFFNHLEKAKEHSENYKYEVSTDPNEWACVERLLPFNTVPEPVIKSHYPSGWRPMKEEALQLPYFVERTRNHMLPVYLRIERKTSNKKTILGKIHGDLWGLFEDLDKHLEEKLGEKQKSYVLEGSGKVFFKGDVVYHIEQWLLSKGF